MRITTAKIEFVVEEKKFHKLKNINSEKKDQRVKRA